MRPSPITLTLASLAATLSIVAALLLARGRKPAEEQASIDLVTPTPPAAAGPPANPRRATAPEPEIPPGPTPPPPPPEPAPIVAGEATATAPAPGGDPVPADDGPRRRRPEVLTANHAQRLQEADELAFATLRLTDDKQAAIRRINEDFKRRVAAGDPERLVVETEARRDAISAALGPALGKDFDAAERVAIRRARGRYRFEWGKQLRQ